MGKTVVAFVLFYIHENLQRVTDKGMRHLYDTCVKNQFL